MGYLQQQQQQQQQLLAGSQAGLTGSRDPGGKMVGDEAALWSKSANICPYTTWGIKAFERSLPGVQVAAAAYGVPGQGGTSGANTGGFTGTSCWFVY